MLVVESDTVWRSRLVDALGACGLDVHVETTDSFIGGLGKLKVGGYACALLSHRLEGGDGLSLVALLRNSGSVDTALVILCDEEDERVEARALELGAEDTLLKFEAVDRLLRRTLRSAQARQRLKAELSTAHARLERIAVNEPLTGLLNRRGLELALRREQSLSRRKGFDNHAILVDLDDFKSINDTHGYDVGDRLLQGVARTLEATVRSTDHVARIGGDEFLVLLPESKLAAGLRLAERIRSRLAALRVAQGGSAVGAQASLGVSRIPAGAATVTDIVANVGAAVRRSKRGGKNRVSLDRELQQATSGRMRTVAEAGALRLDLGMFLLQPIVRLAENEPLAHWVIAPHSPLLREALDAGASLAQEDTLKVHEDRELVEAAVRSVGAWGGGGPCFFSMHPLTLAHTPLSRIKAMFGELDGNPGSGLMLGDHHILGDPHPLKAPVDRLRDAGVALSLRRVGFSRDSLEAVALLRPRLVTLRLGHLLGPRRDRTRIDMVRRLVATLEALGPEIALEGIVGESDRELAHELGITLGIGSGAGELVALGGG